MLVDRTVYSTGLLSDHRAALIGLCCKLGEAGRFLGNYKLCEFAKAGVFAMYQSFSATWPALSKDCILAQLSYKPLVTPTPDA